MAVSEQSVKYRASDGETFNSKAEAERHDALIVARDKYEEAEKAFGILLAETTKTADGCVFEFGWFTYYRIIDGYYWPQLEEVRLCLPRIAVNAGEVTIINTINGNYRDYRVSDLYKSKKFAEKALASLQEDRIADYQRQVDEMKAETGKK